MQTGPSEAYSGRCIKAKWIFLLVALGLHGRLSADTILETSPLGVTNGGASVSEYALQGARFYLDQPYLVTSVGGHIKSPGSEPIPWFNGDRSLFVAINPLQGWNSFPSDFELTDAIFSAVVNAPFNDIGPYPYQVPTTTIQTDFVLDLGYYSIIFGSGLFGATGSGVMPVSFQPLGSPSFFSRWGGTSDLDPYNWRNWNNPPEALRFVVEGTPIGPPGPPPWPPGPPPWPPGPPPWVVVPEPSTLALLGIGILGLIGYGWRRRGRRLGC